MRVIQHISHSVFQENSYILYKNDQIIIIDPGDDFEYYDDYITEGKKVIAILATHGHLDHIISAAKLCEKYQCPFIANSKDLSIINALEFTCDRFNMPYQGTAKISMDISDRDEIEKGDFKIKIFHTPGHTPGSLCFLIDDILFCGDTLFHRSIGRTDLPGGDHEILLRSLKDIMNKLPDSTVVYPGHMGYTTIGDEKKHNPFIIIK